MNLRSWCHCKRLFHSLGKTITISNFVIVGLISTHSYNTLFFFGLIILISTPCIGEISLKRGVHSALNVYGFFKASVRHFSSTSFMIALIDNSILLWITEFGNFNNEVLWSYQVFFRNIKPLLNMLTTHLKIPFQLLLVISNIMGGLVILSVLNVHWFCIIRNNVL